MLGDDCWANYTASVKVRLCGGGDENYVGIGVRHNSSVACEITSNCGFAVKLFRSGRWELLFMDDVVKSGNLEKFTPDDVHTLSITAAGNLYIAYLDGKMLESYNEVGCLQANGRISLLSAYCNNLFTDIEVSPVPSMNTYINYGDALDEAIIYDGSPELKACDSYKFSNRTCTVMHEGDSFETIYMGCGFALCGTVENAVISVIFDGMIISENKKISGTQYRQAFYRCDCVKNTKHTVKLIVQEGEITFDSLLFFKSSPFHSPLESPIISKANEKTSADKAVAVGKTAITAVAGVATWYAIHKFKKYKKRKNRGK